MLLLYKDLKLRASQTLREPFSWLTALSPCFFTQ